MSFIGPNCYPGCLQMINTKTNVNVKQDVQARKLTELIPLFKQNNTVSQPQFISSNACWPEELQ